MVASWLPFLTGKRLSAAELHFHHAPKLDIHLLHLRMQCYLAVSSMLDSNPSVALCSWDFDFSEAIESARR